MFARKYYKKDCRRNRLLLEGACADSQRLSLFSSAVTKENISRTGQAGTAVGERWTGNALMMLM